MNKELVTRILIQLEPSLAQEFGLAIAKDEKKLKALEIIVDKRLDVDEIYNKDYDWYMLDHKNDDKGLIPTKEEYELLKEVLL